jgi:hypothetical protein
MSVSCAYGLTAIALMTMLFPAATLLFVVPLRSVSPVQRLQTGLMKVMASAWVPVVGAFTLDGLISFKSTCRVDVASFTEASRIRIARATYFVVFVANNRLI